MTPASRWLAAGRTTRWNGDLAALCLLESRPTSQIAADGGLGQVWAADRRRTSCSPRGREVPAARSQPRSPTTGRARQRSTNGKPQSLNHGPALRRLRMASMPTVLAKLMTSEATLGPHPGHKLADPSGQQRSLPTRHLPSSPGTLPYPPQVAVALLGSLTQKRLLPKGGVSRSSATSRSQGAPRAARAGVDGARHACASRPGVAVRWWTGWPMVAWSGAATA